MILKKGRYRYNGFYENWKSVKLGNFVEVNPKSFLPRKFKYVDLESVVGTKLISYREEIRESAPSRAQRVAQKGDVFFQTVRPYQKNNYLFDLNEDNYVFSTGYAQLRPKVDSAFLLARLQEEGFVNKVIERCTGTSYPAINSKDLSRISITIPEHFEEQSAIGSLFRTLDDLLTSYEDNIANYQSLKMTMLSKMFPEAGQTVPEIRLNGFEEDWERKSLSEVCTINSGRDYKHLKNGDIPVYGTGGYMLSVNEKLSDEDAIGIGRKGTINKPYLLSAPFWTVDTLFYVICKVGYDLNYLFLIFQKIRWKKFDESTGVPSLSKKTIEKVVSKFPSYEEQRAIGTYFSNLDNLINSYQEKISQLETLKKKLLQDMFI